MTITSAGPKRGPIRYRPLPATGDARLASSGDGRGPYSTFGLEGLSTFAHLCGVAPLDASSGKNERHRLNRGGDRQANSALWRIVITRMVCDARTHEYIERRMKEGLSKKEAFRCLKRYIAREVYNHPPRAELALDNA